MSYRIVPFQQAHLPHVVELHVRTFPGFFLSSLGPGFLREFYASFLRDPQGIGLVAEAESGKVLGVVAGPLNPRGYFRRLVRSRWLRFCCASLTAVARRPTVAPRLLRALWYRGEPPAGPPRSLLSSVAVAPETQGQGVGAALVRHWVEETRRRGATGCYLTTDAEGNERVNRFYRSQGWLLERSFTTPEGRRMNCYVLDLAPAAGRPADQPEVVRVLPRERIT